MFLWSPLRVLLLLGLRSAPLLRRSGPLRPALRPLGLVLLFSLLFVLRVYRNHRC
jgi:hypothetical protein